jgi:hypothetical protein
MERGNQPQKLEKWRGEGGHGSHFSPKNGGGLFLSSSKIFGEKFWGRSWRRR